MSAMAMLLEGLSVVDIADEDDPLLYVLRGAIAAPDEVTLVLLEGDKSERRLVRLADLADRDYWRLFKDPAEASAYVARLGVGA